MNYGLQESMNYYALKDHKKELWNISSDCYNSGYSSAVCLASTAKEKVNFAGYYSFSVLNNLKCKSSHTLYHWQFFLMDLFMGGQRGDLPYHFFKKKTWNNMKQTFSVCFSLNCLCLLLNSSCLWVIVWLE